MNPRKIAEEAKRILEKELKLDFELVANSDDDNYFLKSKKVIVDPYDESIENKILRIFKVNLDATIHSEGLSLGQNSEYVEIPSTVLLQIVKNDFSELINKQKNEAQEKTTARARGYAVTGTAPNLQTQSSSTLFKAPKDPGDDDYARPKGADQLFSKIRLHLSAISIELKGKNVSDRSTKEKKKEALDLIMHSIKSKNALTKCITKIENEFPEALTFETKKEINSVKKLYGIETKPATSLTKK